MFAGVCWAMDDGHGKSTALCPMCCVPLDSQQLPPSKRGSSCTQKCCHGWKAEGAHVGNSGEGRGADSRETQPDGTVAQSLSGANFTAWEQATDADTGPATEEERERLSRIRSVRQARQAKEPLEPGELDPFIVSSRAQGQGWTSQRRMRKRISWDDVVWQCLASDGCWEKRVLAPRTTRDWEADGQAQGRPWPSPRATRDWVQSGVGCVFVSTGPDGCVGLLRICFNWVTGWWMFVGPSVWEASGMVLLKSGSDAWRLKLVLTMWRWWTIQRMLAWYCTVWSDLLQWHQGAEHMVIHDGIIFNQQFVDFGHPKTSMLRLCKKMFSPLRLPCAASFLGAFERPLNPEPMVAQRSPWSRDSLRLGATWRKYLPRIFFEVSFTVHHEIICLVNSQVLMN